jgi:hypothetical protein
MKAGVELSALNHLFFGWLIATVTYANKAEIGRKLGYQKKAKTPICFALLPMIKLELERLLTKVGLS